MTRSAEDRSPVAEPAAQWPAEDGSAYAVHACRSRWGRALPLVAAAVVLVVLAAALVGVLALSPS